MDEIERILGNKCLATLKDNSKMLAAALTEYVYHQVDLPESKKILNYDEIYKYLESLSLIEIIYNSEGRGKPQVIKLTTIGKNYDSIEQREQELHYQEFNRKKKEEQEENDKELDREYKRRQIWLSKYWYVTAFISTLIGALLQKIFNLL